MMADRGKYGQEDENKSQFSDTVNDMTGELQISQQDQPELTATRGTNPTGTAGRAPNTSTTNNTTGVLQNTQAMPASQDHPEVTVTGGIMPASQGVPDYVEPEGRPYISMDLQGAWLKRHKSNSRQRKFQSTITTESPPAIVSTSETRTPRKTSQITASTTVTLISGTAAFHKPNAQKHESEEDQTKTSTQRTTGLQLAATELTSTLGTIPAGPAPQSSTVNNTTGVLQNTQAMPAAQDHPEVTAVTGTAPREISHHQYVTSRHQSASSRAGESNNPESAQFRYEYQ